jgi:Uma2 family endonuclease
MGELKLSNIHCSVDEYFALDKEGEHRYEYENGQLWIMAGTNIPHNDIRGNIEFLIRTDMKTKKRKCKIQSENVRVEVVPKFVYYYPDLVFSCNEEDLKDKKMLRKPSLIIEVLSDSSFYNDLRWKMDNYMKMETLKYYLVVEQSKCIIRCFEKIEGKWIYSLYTEMTEIISLPQIDISLAVADIYEGIEFE